MLDGRLTGWSYAVSLYRGFFLLEKLLEKLMKQAYSLIY